MGLWRVLMGHVLSVTAVTSLAADNTAIPTGSGGNGVDQTFMLDEIEVSERRTGGFESYQIEPNGLPETGGDPSRLMRGVPGGNFNSNGPLAGQIQYRGMFGPRVNTLINGMPITSGGPNLMDPPTHYAPRSQVASVTVHRGISPVSAGPEAIGGTVDIETRTSGFTQSDALTSQGRIQGGFQSANNGFVAGAMVGVANRTHRFHLVGGGIESGDTGFASDSGLSIRPSEQERIYAGAGYGVRLGEHEISVDYRRFDTDQVGNPSLAQDTEFVETDRFNSHYRANLGDLALQGRLSYQDVGHAMNNFALRTAPNTFGPPLGANQSMAPKPFRGRDRRRVVAEAQGLGGEFSASMPSAGGNLTLGGDFQLAGHNMRVFDPDSSFFAQPFNNIDRNRYSVFSEWGRALDGRWRMTTGMRYTYVATEAGRGEAPGLPPAQRLQDGFNSSDRDHSDHLVDAVVEFERQLGTHASLEIGLGRKSRAPSYIERFAWLPIEATAGLGDGNNHVGNLNLDPEVSHQMELGLDWNTQAWYLTPRVFYREVDDYIQGTPVASSETDLIKVSTVNGDADPLRFNNVEAEFYGIDSGFGYRFSNRWRGDGTISYVRGRRGDTNDNLFRIAPLNGTLSLSYEVNDWRLIARSVWAADQDKVSETNDEPESDGFAIYNLFARWRAVSGLSVMVGVENLFDDRYRDHLAGFNRVSGSDIGGATAPPATRENRIPGPGRNLTARIEYHW